MTTKELHAAGYIVTKGRPIGSTMPPWRIMRVNSQAANPYVLGHYPTRKAAIADLVSEMTDPDGTLRA